MLSDQEEKGHPVCEKHLKMDIWVEQRHVVQFLDAAHQKSGCA